MYLNFDQSVCMTAISYSGPISIIYSEIIALPWIIIYKYTKFFEDILSNKKCFYTGTWFCSISLLWQLYAIVVRYRQFRQISSSLGRKRRVCNFRSIFQKFTDADHIYMYVWMDAVEEIIFPRFVTGVINYVANLI